MCEHNPFSVYQWNLKAIILFLISFKICNTTAWTTVTTPPLPVANSRMASGYYDGSIFLVGGWEQYRQLVEYDISQNNMIDLGTTTITADVCAEGQWYTQHNNILYMIERMDSTRFATFNLQTKTFTPNWNSVVIPNIALRSCIASYNNILFVIAGHQTNPTYTYFDAFHAYNLSSNSWLSGTPSLNKARKSFSCVVHPDTDTLYAIGGYECCNPETETIETLDVTTITSSSWQYSDNLIYPAVNTRAVVAYEDIFVVGDGSNVVQIIDSATGQVTTGPVMNYIIRNPGLINVDGTIYSFGGVGGCCNYWLDSWQHYTVPPPTPSPTGAPTFSPSVAPTTSPSESPTKSPSFAPSSAPSNAPSQPPTAAPSSVPTYPPSRSPSSAPTQPPTQSPTQTPSQSPSQPPSSVPSSPPSFAPSASPTLSPSDSPSIAPSVNPTSVPSSSPSQPPTRFPSASPSQQPTNAPSSAPSVSPSFAPTRFPSNHPTNAPSFAPTQSPTEAPSMNPTSVPSNSPSQPPTRFPSTNPSHHPTNAPSSAPSASPTLSPSNSPSNHPTNAPSCAPTQSPTEAPSMNPTSWPSSSPSQPPTRFPSTNPSHHPTNAPSSAPSASPTLSPSNSPSKMPTNPSKSPSNAPSAAPSQPPSRSPSVAPSSPPTLAPSLAPSLAPTQPPSRSPSMAPSIAPSRAPTTAPSGSPSFSPTGNPTYPSVSPTFSPTLNPSQTPTISPSSSPTQPPTKVPTTSPSFAPSFSPTKNPSFPTINPTGNPTNNPTSSPSLSPSASPTMNPTFYSSNPSMQPTHPSVNPTFNPTVNPTVDPTYHPTVNPTRLPTKPPTHYPSTAPTETPTLVPSQPPSVAPSNAPSTPPTSSPTHHPSNTPSNAPTHNPTLAPSSNPTESPTTPSPTEPERATCDSRVIGDYNDEMLPITVEFHNNFGVITFDASHSDFSITQVLAYQIVQDDVYIGNKLDSVYKLEVDSEGFYKFIIKANPGVYGIFNITISCTLDTSTTPPPSTDAPTQVPSNIPITAFPPSQSPVSDIISSQASTTDSPTYVPVIITMSDTVFDATFDAETAEFAQYQQDLDDLEGMYEMVFLIVVSLFAVMLVAAWADSKYIRANDYLKINQILGMAVQTLDMLSDCFFAANVNIQSQIDSQYLIAMIFAIFFIVTPAFMTILQLHFQCKRWIHSSDQVRGWLSQNLKHLYFLSIFTGSSFAAITLVNSYLFQLGICDMGLTDKEVSAFMYKRVYSVVLVENVPQLALQIWFIGSLTTLDDPSITITSMVFSLISILISVLSMLTERKISQTQGHVAISMKVTGHAVTSNPNNCKTLKDVLTEELALLVGVHASVVEVIKPMQIKQGFKLNVNFYFGDAGKRIIDYHKILMEANKAEELQELFEKSWKLSGKPTIDDITQNTVQSKSRKETKEAIEKQLAEYQMNENAANAQEKIQDGNGTQT
eukprot:582565_1